MNKSRLISVDAALAYVLERARPVRETDTLPLERSLGRVVAVSQTSQIDVPEFDNSSMDGYAIRSEDADVPGCVELLVTQRIPAGQPGHVLNRGEAARIFTGAPLPQGADAVVMQEDCEGSDAKVSFEGPVPPTQHVRPRGNNIAMGAEVLPVGIRIRPQEMGIAAAVGMTEIPVTRRLRVAFFSSGDELVTPGEHMRRGQIPESNGVLLAALLLGGALKVGGDLGNDPAIEGSLKPEKVHREAAEEIVERLELHYRRLKFDDALSAQVLEQYLQDLDPNRLYFTQQDVDDFQPYRDQLDNTHEAEVQQQAQTDMLKSEPEAIYDDGFSWIGGNPEGDIVMIEFMVTTASRFGGFIHLRIFSATAVPGTILLC